MSLQDLLSETPSDDLDRFMELARESHTREDVLLLECMVEQGMTPWQASARTAERVERSPHSLYVRARTLVVEVHSHFGKTPEAWAADLLDTGEITGVPTYLVAAVRSLVEAEGRTLTQMVTLRLEEG